jgi:predicted nicotinamide N-methyase
MELDEFICANTAIGAPPLVPEISLYLATELTPLWYATESFLNQRNMGAPFWAFAWVGGQALARYILDKPSVVDGLYVADVGSGGGLVSIAAAKAGAKAVAAIDIDPVAEVVCALNAALNNVGDLISATRGDAITFDLSRFDIILVGDVCYTRGEAEELTDHLRRVAAPVLFGDPGRQFMPREDLLHLAAYSIPTSTEIEAKEVTQASVWRMI